ncbi:MAG: redox-sensing transcriptional repressor Rex [Elusimicrobiota bacterium]
MSRLVDDQIPEGVIERLPLYLNALIQLRQEGEPIASSAVLGALSETNPAQIRRDLTHFGSFGKRGIGYDTVTLIDRIQKILGSDHTHRVALVGGGHLGQAIASHDGLPRHGFHLSAAFDTDPHKVGTAIGDAFIQDVTELERTITDQSIRIAVMAVPPKAAQEVADRLVAAGVRVIINYTPQIVKVPPEVTLHNTDPVQELLHTLYYLSRQEGVAHA